MSHWFGSFPEELLARILAICVSPRPDLVKPRNRLAPLLVSRQFLRIAAPLFYHTLHLQSAHQASRVLDTLRHHPPLAGAVRRIVFAGIWHDCACVLSLCKYVQDVDVCLDGRHADRTTPGPLNADASDVVAETFCFALEQRHAITHLTIRKDPAVYLTHPRPVYVLQRLAQAVHNWPNLEAVHFALRISSSPNTLPLARALSTAPRLRSVRAQLPAVWNNILLIVSTNPALEKVMLYSESAAGPPQCRPNLGQAVIKGGYTCDDVENAVLGTSLYMMEAKKHARLSELIKAGTSIIRTRAHTTVATLSSQPAGGTPLGAIRAKEVAAELLANRDSIGVVAAQPCTAIRPAPFIVNLPTRRGG